MSRLMSVIAKYPYMAKMGIEWDDDFSIMASLDTMYETFIGEEGEHDYKEYWATAFRIDEIIRHSQKSRKYNIQSGLLYEVSEIDEPRVISIDGKIIWERDR
ncbi:hypothetical protein [Bacillus sp. FJAT-42315]|uniref:hypothetical protein n=1 Tax=Bacillus sp. FJAT-42315 TaxID=2014077 RepID=UPI000C237A9E|nr:hypothetical protein [Bacillus sp. FJAT-42315]